MINSLIRQKKQIRSSEDYKDLNFVDGLQGERELEYNIHDPIEAEKVRTLEDDINNIRTQLNKVIGLGVWYAEPLTNINQINEIIKNIQFHEEFYHHKRNDDTNFIFDGDKLTNIEVTVDNTIKQNSVFEYDGNTLLSITKTIWDNNLNEYIKQKKDFIYDYDGNLLSIKNTLI